MAKKHSVTETTAVATWDERLAREAQIAAEVEKGSGGKFFGLRGGILTYDGIPVPGNKMCVVILDSLLENVYYAEAYDPEAMTSPKCFAFGREESTMTPHAAVVARGDAQHAQCTGCARNVFGSADIGKGKACRNTRRLAIIPAGTFDKETLTLFTRPDQFTGSIGFLKLPVTSVKEYSVFVKQLTGMFKRPPYAFFTTIQVHPDAKNQFKTTFQPVQQVPDALIPTLMTRNEEAKASIDFPYPVSSPPISTPDAAGGTTAKKIRTKKNSRKY